MKEKIKAEIKYGEYFNYGYRFYLTFTYSDSYQKKEVYNIFSKELVPRFGSHSYNKEYIMPFFVDEFGTASVENTKIIGGTNLPKDIMNDIIEILVLYTNISLKINHANTNIKLLK